MHRKFSRTTSEKDLRMAITSHVRLEHYRPYYDARCYEQRSYIIKHFMGAKYCLH